MDPLLQARIRIHAIWVAGTKAGVLLSIDPKVAPGVAVGVLSPPG